ncbi:15127_t:CDS:2 [Acaulospora morrowiae]|uniref:15127_t:CDS:1 n=1 Tax=Acaulospora morrowiae TaxID=94023 RepID=A0A9N9DQW9_9GLOM|nr:15127_t:CDS:2 [Acaulospora morrowiae]
MYTHTSGEDPENSSNFIKNFVEIFKGILGKIIDNKFTEKEHKEFIEAAKSIDINSLNATFKNLYDFPGEHLRIKEKSEQIYEILLRIDGCNLDKKCWAPEWNTLCRRYKNLMMNSKEDARTLSTYSRNHVKKTLPILKSNKISKAEKENHIKRIRNFIEKNKEKAKKNSVNFDQYKRDVIKFSFGYVGILVAGAYQVPLALTVLNKIGCGTTLAKIVCGTALAGTSYGCSYAACKTRNSVIKNELKEKQIVLYKQIEKASAWSEQIIESLNKFEEIADIISSFWEVIDSCLNDFLNDESVYGDFLNSIPQDEYKLLEDCWNVFAVSLDIYVSEVTKVKVKES